MSNSQKLQKALKLSKSSNDIIVAFSTTADFTKVENSASKVKSKKMLENSSFPILLKTSGYCFVFGRSEQFNDEAYRENYLEKCRNLSNVEIDIL